MTLTRKQEEGLKIIVDRYNAGQPYVTIAGFAGTGKTYLVAKAMEALNLREGEYKMAAFTGKAALVLRQRGFEAVTLHKLLYKSIPIDKEGTSFVHVPKKFREDFDGTKVLVIDEISMVPNNILKEAAKHKIFIIALGDPFQLPPIGEDNGLLQAPHVFLDEIVRQEEDSSIIRISQAIRNYDGRPIEFENDDTVQIVSRDEVVDGMLHWADQILCFKNNTRRQINDFMREQLKRSSFLPENGDKIIFTKNNWDRLNGEGYALVNGMIGYVSDVEIGEPMGILGQIAYANVTTDFSDSMFLEVPMDSNIFQGTQPMPQEGKGKNRVEHADYGYAITIHKSQGSEFDKVLLYEEQLRRNIDLQGLYTGETRAKEKLVIVKSDKNSKFK